MRREYKLSFGAKFIQFRSVFIALVTTALGATVILLHHLSPRGIFATKVEVVIYVITALAVFWLIRDGRRFGVYAKQRLILDNSGIRQVDELYGWNDLSRATFLAEPVPGTLIILETKAGEEIRISNEFSVDENFTQVIIDRLDSNYESFISTIYN